MGNNDRRSRSREIVRDGKQGLVWLKTQNFFLLRINNATLRDFTFSDKFLDVCGSGNFHKKSVCVYFGNC